MASLKEIAEREPTKLEVWKELFKMARNRLVKKSVTEHMQNMFAEVEKEDQKVDRVVMNAENYFVLRDNARDIMEVESKSFVMIQGMFGYIWEAKVMVNKHAGEPVYWPEQPSRCMQITDERPYDKPDA